MSGFGCLFGRQQASLRGERVELMTDAIDHRGPDGSGTWVASHIGLGHQQLQTTPAANREQQPSRFQDAVCVGDIRLDNRPELLQSLPVNTSSGSVPDSDLLLHAYHKWGKDCVGHIDGAFAFAIWDLAEQRCFCARDRFGVKPFYYYSSDRLFAAGSEPKSMLRLPSIGGTIDDIAVGDMLMHNFEDQEHTYFESIQRLPPATALTITADAVNRWTYWELDPARQITRKSDKAYARRFRELFAQAVQRRLRTHKPIGSDLSGGLDSTAVTVMARDLLPSSEPLHTFSNLFEDAPASDEREFFELVTERDDITAHKIYLDETKALVDQEEVVRYLDHPPHDTMHFAKWERLKAASEVGIGVQLSGVMGDSAVGYGFGMLPRLLRTGRLYQLFHELRAMGDVVGAPTRQLLRQNALDPLIPTTLKRLYRKLKGKPVCANRSNPTLAPEFVREYNLQDRYKTYDYTGSILKRSGRRWQHRSLTSGRITATLETMDMMHAAHGIEPRHPFTDRRLVEFTLAIPPSQQLANGYTRSIIRRGLGELLPEKIQWRPWKTMVGQAKRNALANDDEALKRLVDDPHILSKYIDPDALRHSYEAFSKTTPSVDSRCLWKALSLAVWLEARADTDSITNPAQL